MIIKKLNINKFHYIVFLVCLTFLLSACGYHKNTDMETLTLAYQGMNVLNSKILNPIFTWTINCPTLFDGNNWTQTTTTKVDNLSFTIPKNSKCILSLNQFINTDLITYLPEFGTLTLSLDENGFANKTQGYLYKNIDKTKEIIISASVDKYKLTFYGLNQPKPQPALPLVDPIKITLVPLKLNIIYNTYSPDSTDIMALDINCPNAFNGMGYLITNVTLSQKEAMNPKDDCSNGICIIQGEQCFLTLKYYIFHIYTGFNSTLFSDKLIPRSSGLIINLNKFGLIPDKFTSQFNYMFQDKYYYKDVEIKACNTINCISESVEKFSIFLNFVY